MRAVTEVPEDVWRRVMSHSELAEVMVLEQTCKTFRDLSKSRPLWLKLLRELEAHEPPNVPPHIPLKSLGYDRLRELVTEARRRDAFWRTSPTLRKLHETTFTYRSSEVGDIFDPTDFAPELFVLPGGEYVLSMWPDVEGYLMCWSVTKRKWLWSYPVRNERDMALNNFAYDMRENGDIHFLFIEDTATNPRFLSESCLLSSYSPSTNSFTTLRKGSRLDFHFGLADIVKLKDEVSIVYQKFGGILTFDFPDEKSLIASGANLDSIELADGFLFVVSTSRLGDKTLLVISLAETYQRAQDRREASSPDTVSLQDIVLCSKPLRPQYKTLQKATLTLNTLHWKQKLERDRILVTIYVPFRDSVSTAMEPPSASFTFFKDPKLQRSSRLVFNAPPISDSFTGLSNHPSTSYVSFTPPSLSGHMLTLLCSGSDPSHPGQDNALAITKLDRKGSMMFKVIEPWEYNTLYPYDWYEASMDMYSNTLAVSTGRHEKIVVSRFE